MTTLFCQSESIHIDLITSRNEGGQEGESDKGEKMGEGEREKQKQSKKEEITEDRTTKLKIYSQASHPC